MRVMNYMELVVCFSVLFLGLAVLFSPRPIIHFKQGPVLASASMPVVIIIGKRMTAEEKQRSLALF